MCTVKSPRRGVGIATVAVAAADFPVTIVYAKLGLLRLAHCPPCIDRFTLGLMVTGGTLCATSFDVPPTLWIGYYMMGVRAFFSCHFVPLFIKQALKVCLSRTYASTCIFR
jgi:hypothetical protein